MSFPSKGKQEIILSTVKNRLECFCVCDLEIKSVSRKCAFIFTDLFRDLKHEFQLSAIAFQVPIWACKQLWKTDKFESSTDNFVLLFFKSLSTAMLSKTGYTYVPFPGLSLTSLCILNSRHYIHGGSVFFSFIIGSKRKDNCKASTLSFTYCFITVHNSA